MTTELLPNRYYHIYNRGNNREKLFYQPANYAFFLQRYFKFCYPVLETYAYCLMSNHFHMLVSVRPHEEAISLAKKHFVKLSDPPIVSRQMSHFMNSYAQSINKQVGRVGSLFQKTFKRKEVENEDYFRQLVRYIHWNPKHHNFVDDFKEYPYSSFNHYQYPDPNETLIYTEKALQIFGGLDNFLSAHTTFSDKKDMDEEFRSL